MEKKELLGRIHAVIDTKSYNLDTYKDLYACLKDLYEEDKDFLFANIETSRSKISQKLKKDYEMLDIRDIQELDNLLYKSYLLTAKDIFSDFLIALEWGRLPKERFYEPRKKQLEPIVNALQDFADDKLDELFLSMIPRAGKTTLVMMYMLWSIGRNSEKSNLYVSYSDVITSAFYSGLLEILQDNNTYRYGDIFPEAKIMGTNAKEETLDLDRRKRYHSMTCRSLYGTLNGACDCNGILVSDDLISGIEEAMNRDRLISAWSKVENNMLSRAKEHAKILWIGTRWSIIDPIGLRQELLLNDEKFNGRRYKIVDLPALDEYDESNFDYDFGVGYSTEHLQRIRASFERMGDIASWNAQYMQQPIEREGTVFDPVDMRYFNGVLPEEAPDRKFMVVDPAWGGGDFVASPVCYQYDEDIYVVDVVYSNEEKTVTQPLLANTIMKYQVDRVQVEANKTTSEFKDGIDENLRRLGYRCTITTKVAPNNKAKEQRIFDKAPDIREHFIFLEDGKRTREYQLFMQNVYSFKITGKNKHDDAPDSLCMAADLAFYQAQYQPKIFKKFI